MKNQPAADSSLNETNFREFARKAIEKYEQRGMLIDAMLWSAIIGHYNTALDSRKPPVDPNKPDDCLLCKGTGKVKRRSNAHALAISKAHFNRCELVDEAREVRRVVGAEKK